MVGAKIPTLIINENPDETVVSMVKIFNINLKQEEII